jgi:hypothetical protein
MSLDLMNTFFFSECYVIFKKHFYFSFMKKDTLLVNVANQNIAHHVIQLFRICL